MTSFTLDVYDLGKGLFDISQLKCESIDKAKYSKTVYVHIENINTHEKTLFTNKIVYFCFKMDMNT